MLVAFYCRDSVPSNPSVRLDALPAHLNWVEANMDSIKVAGPLKEDSIIVGSLYVLEATSVLEAEKILHTDPYFKAGIWQSIDSQDFSAYAGTWVGGKNWPT